MRAIRTHQYLYIRNFEPDRWPTGGPVSTRGPEYSDIDASPTKKFIVEHKDDPEYARFFELACGKRPAEELYDLQKDPHQLNNAAYQPEYEEIRKKLWTRLESRLRQTEDPRIYGKGDELETYPYYGSIEKK